MASAFIRVEFLNFNQRDRVAREVAYLTRTSGTGSRGRVLDYTGVAQDFVCAEIRLPEHAPDGFADIAGLAKAADAAERLHMRKTRGRVRWPQVAAALIIALPPDDELSIDEVIELVARIVDRVVGQRNLAAISVIHDPRLETPDARNRHAHVLVLLREVDRIGMGQKTRDLFAVVRRSANGFCYVRAGIDWPRLSLELQQLHFAELALDRLVDPPAPFPDRHWSRQTLSEDPQRVAAYRDEIRAKNLQLINGQADVFVDRLLKGRTALPVEELSNLLERIIDSEDEPRDRLDAILADPAIVTLGRYFGEARPSWLTTRTVDAMIAHATSLVDRAKRDSAANAAAIRVISQPSAAAVDRNIAELVVWPRPLMVGTTVDCDALRVQLTELRPDHVTVQELLEPTHLAGADVPVANRVVVVPRSKTLDDQTLAAILSAAEADRATLILGYDESRGNGTVGQRLAAYAADVLGDSDERSPGWIERQLRAGRLERALNAMHERGIIRFWNADERTLSGANFVVCDEDRIDAVNERLRALHAADAVEVPIELPNRKLRLRTGQWIALTQTDYSCCPPKLREGQLGRILEISPDSRSIRVELTDGSAEIVDLDRHPHVRPAFAITVREARRAPPASKLLIAVTRRRHIWAMLLLAATRYNEQIVVHVDPGVARDIAELVLVGRRSLPAALTNELAPWRTIVEPREGWLDDRIELMPEPAPIRTAPPQTSKAPAPTKLPRRIARVSIPPDLTPAVRAILAKVDGQEALQRLKDALAPGQPNRMIVSKGLLDLCEPDGPTEAVIKAVITPDRQSLDEPLTDLDLPSPLATAAAPEWSPWDLYRFQIDLSTMTCPGSIWQGVFPPPSPMAPDSQPDDAAPQLPMR